MSEFNRPFVTIKGKNNYDPTAEPIPWTDGQLEEITKDYNEIWTSYYGNEENDLAEKYKQNFFSYLGKRQKSSNEFEISSG